MNTTFNSFMHKISTYYIFHKMNAFCYQSKIHQTKSFVLTNKHFLQYLELSVHSTTLFKSTKQKDESQLFLAIVH